jgi:hypothetical protein
LALLWASVAQNGSDASTFAVPNGKTIGPELYMTPSSRQQQLLEANGSITVKNRH